MEDLDNSEGDFDFNSTPEELVETARNVSFNLLPEKSKIIYERKYQRFSSRIVGVKGPTNTREYEVAVYFRGRRLASAIGCSIQTAEMNAAKSALKESGGLFPQLNHQKRVISQSLNKTGNAKVAEKSVSTSKYKNTPLAKKQRQVINKSSEQTENISNKETQLIDAKPIKFESAHPPEKTESISNKETQIKDAISTKLGSVTSPKQTESISNKETQLIDPKLMKFESVNPPEKTESISNKETQLTDVIPTKLESVNPPEKTESISIKETQLKDAIPIKLEIVNSPKKTESISNQETQLTDAITITFETVNLPEQTESILNKETELTDTIPTKLLKPCKPSKDQHCKDQVQSNELDHTLKKIKEVKNDTDEVKCTQNSENLQSNAHHLDESKILTKEEIDIPISSDFSNQVAKRKKNELSNVELKVLKETYLKLEVLTPNEQETIFVSKGREGYMSIECRSKDSRYDGHQPSERCQKEFSTLPIRDRSKRSLIRPFSNVDRDKQPLGKSGVSQENKFKPSTEVIERGKSKRSLSRPRRYSSRSKSPRGGWSRQRSRSKSRNRTNIRPSRSKSRSRTNRTRPHRSSSSSKCLSRDRSPRKTGERERKKPQEDIKKTLRDIMLGNNVSDIKKATPASSLIDLMFEKKQHPVAVLSDALNSSGYNGNYVNGYQSRVDTRTQGNLVQITLQNYSNQNQFQRNDPKLVNYQEDWSDPYKKQYAEQSAQGYNGNSAASNFNQQQNQYMYEHGYQYGYNNRCYNNN